MMPTVLIVEDFGPLRSLYSKFLTANGYSVTQASSCREALTILSTFVPDVALLDMQLPDGDGLSLVSFLKPDSRFKNTRIIAVTASPKYQQFADAYGIDHFMNKPVSMPSLINLIDRITKTNMFAIAS